jgi:hypothetical protein
VISHIGRETVLPSHQQEHEWQQDEVFYSHFRSVVARPLWDAMAKWDYRWNAALSWRFATS